MPLQHSINFDNTYAAQMEGFYVPWQGEAVPDPAIVQFNAPLAVELGLDADDLNSAAGAALFAGSELPDGASPLAQVYAGHQFGGFSHQLGDGRALLVGEVIDQNGKRRDIQLKGSGRTPFSRGGDGKAALGPVLREYLIGEAMHALGIPTTRALAAVTTGEDVAREEPLPGAVLARVASSHLRVGTFQFFAARKEVEKLRTLADYAIKRHYPDIRENENPYLALLKKVIEQQASLIARWMSVGFIHGVMNTDNMTISGETIDYGPCAFMDGYNSKTVFSSIDEMGRYAFGNQPPIAQWNLARLAEALLPLIDADDSDKAVAMATEALDGFSKLYQDQWLGLMGGKLGLSDEQDGDVELIQTMLGLLEQNSVDYTQFFRRLADTAGGNSDGLFDLFEDKTSMQEWHEKWIARTTDDGVPAADRAAAMNRINPIYIPRNHKVEEALQAAVRQSDYGPFNKLLDVLSSPYEPRDGLDEYARPAPASFAHYKTFCGT